MEPTIINEIREVKNKLDILFEKRKENYQGQTTERFTIKTLYEKIVVKNFDQEIIDKLTKDFYKLCPCYNSLLEIEKDMTAGNDVQINKLCNHFNSSKFFVNFHEKSSKFIIEMTMADGKEVTSAEL